MPLRERSGLIGLFAVGLFAVGSLCSFRPVRGDAEAFSLGPILVYEAQPEKTIKHGVEWKGPFDPARRESVLGGPSYYGSSVGLGDQPASRLARFNWYKIAVGEEVLPTSVAVWTESDDKVPREFKLGAPTYFLSTTQRLSEGTPTPVPGGLSHFIAYRITSGTADERSVTLSTDSTTREVVLRRPILFCAPAEEWHHTEHFPVKNPAACLVVYEIQPLTQEATITTLDQFGLHSLQLGRGVWLCVPGKEFRVKTSDN